MSLLLLRATPHASIYFDQLNHWLYVEWQGKVSLPAAQLACLELARIFVPRPYQRVLISHAQATGFEWDVPGWLAQELLPYLALAGVEQLAWVSGATARGHDVVHDLLQRLPPLPIVCFDDEEMAVALLQRTSPRPAGAYVARLPATTVLLRQAVQRFMRRILTQLRYYGGTHAGAQAR